MLFSIACGLFLVQLLILLYFNILPPIPKSLTGFYGVIVIKILAIGIIAYILLKKGKKLAAVWLIGAALIVLVFGIPIFIAENHHHLEHLAFSKGIEPQTIEFSEATIRCIKSMYELYADIWRRVYIPVHLSIGVFFGIVIYRLMKRRKKK